LVTQVFWLFATYGRCSEMREMWLAAFVAERGLGIALVG